jgi:hypothetical protein
MSATGFFALCVLATGAGTPRTIVTGAGTRRHLGDGRGHAAQYRFAGALECESACGRAARSCDARSRRESAG